MTDGLKPNSELEALLVDSEEGDVDKALRQALEGRVALQRGQSRALSRPGLFELQLRDRLLLLLLARHAMKRLGLTEGLQASTAEMLASEGQIPVQRAREYLSRLKSRGVVGKTDEGYIIPSWNIIRAIDELGRK
jgi:hypothetical protein